MSLQIQIAPHLQLMGYKEYRLAFGGTPYSFIKDMGTHTSVNSTERVIQEKYGPLAVQCTSHAHSLTLSPTQVGTSLPNLERKRKKYALTVVTLNFKLKLLWVGHFRNQAALRAQTLWACCKKIQIATDTSVMSPYGSSARSGSRQQASRTALYLMRIQRHKIRDKS